MLDKLKLLQPLLRAVLRTLHSTRPTSPHFTRMLCALLVLALQVSPEGRILQLLLDPTGARVATASAATEHNGRLFLGSIMGGEGMSVCCHTLLSGADGIDAMA
jgi:hypothetical protein